MIRPSRFWMPARENRSLSVPSLKRCTRWHGPTTGSFSRWAAMTGLSRSSASGESLHRILLIAIFPHPAFGGVRVIDYFAGYVEEHGGALFAVIGGPGRQIGRAGVAGAREGDPGFVHAPRKLLWRLIAQQRPHRCLRDIVPDKGQFERVGRAESSAESW